MLQSPDGIGGQDPAVSRGLGHWDDQAAVVLRFVRLEPVGHDGHRDCAGDRLLGPELFGGAADVSSHRLFQLIQVVDRLAK